MQIADFTELPEPARDVIATAVAEAWANTDHGDAQTAADVAADIIRVLERNYLDGE